ncbi:hypothetical protein Ancab_004146 [Ancistrocladus abbreviatus]
MSNTYYISTSHQIHTKPMLPSTMQNLQRLITSNLGDKTLTMHPLPKRHQFVINPLLRTYSFKINSSSRVQPTTTTHAVHQTKGSLHEYEESARPIVNYDPNSWGDRFMNYTPDDEITQAIRKEEAERLKAKVKEQLLAAHSDQLQWLSYVSTLELLGVAYHFNNEIDEGLLHSYKNYNSWDEEENLHHISLGFRLLRQHGFHVPTDIFKKFKDEKGCFKESLTADAEGILALFEASYVRMHGENILEEACNFTTTCLKSMVTQANYPLAIRVNHALKHPLHRFFSRLDHKHYILVYETNPLHDKALLKFAKLDFNMVQALHRKELNDLTSWWKGKNLATTLPFARDRMVELYCFFALTFSEPQYSALRVALAKANATLTMIDDIYDGYGTIEELELFTEALERWDKSFINQLPNYMRSIYTSHLDVYEEVEKVLAKEGRSNCIEHTREATSSQQRDGMLSTIITYTKHFNVSKEEAIEELCKQVDDFWKDLNQEMLQPNVVRMPIITCLVRLARSVEITWRDGYDPLLVVHQCYKDDIEKVFIEPFPI